MLGNRIELVDSELWYAPNFFGAYLADGYLNQLTDELDWHQGDVQVFGTWYKTPRLQAWHADPGISYRYSGTDLTAKPWTPALIDIRQALTDVGLAFNSVLANLYRDGNDRMGWHADNEPELGKQPVIASLSFGAQRDFDLRHRFTGEKYRLPLMHGSLLVMAGSTQSCWQHSLPVGKRVTEPRLNLTFRQIIS